MIAAFVLLPVSAREYAMGHTALKLDGLVVKITQVFLPDTINSSMRALFHRNRGYAYAEPVQ